MGGKTSLADVFHSEMAKVQETCLAMHANHQSVFISLWQKW
jgi:hypothetical protein